MLSTNESRSSDSLAFELRGVKIGQSLGVQPAGPKEAPLGRGYKPLPAKQRWSGGGVLARATACCCKRSKGLVYKALSTTAFLC